MRGLFGGSFGWGFHLRGLWAPLRRVLGVLPGVGYWMLRLRVRRPFRLMCLLYADIRSVESHLRPVVRLIFGVLRLAQREPAALSVSPRGRFVVSPGDSASPVLGQNRT